MVFWILSTSSATGRPLQAVRKTSPTIGGPMVPSIASPWHEAHWSLYNACARAAWAAEYTPAATERAWRASPVIENQPTTTHAHAAVPSAQRTADMPPEDTLIRPSPGEILYRASSATAMRV